MNILPRLAGLALAVTLALPLAATAQLANSLQGEVLEVLNVDSYTYMRLKTSSGEAWVAVTTATVAKGAKAPGTGATVSMPSPNSSRYTASVCCTMMRSSKWERAFR